MRDRDLCGVIAASLTPVTAGLEVDCERLAAHVSRLLDAGCSFVSTFGTTGEGTSFSVRQKVAALEALAADGIDMARLTPAVMSPTVDDAAVMLDALARLRCRAAVVLPPFYYGAVNDGIVAFYDAVFDRARGADIGVILYNIPQLSRVRFGRELVRSLVERQGSRIVGLKDSTGDRDNSVMLAESFPELSVFVGDDRLLPDMLAAGGAGLIGGMPNLFAEDIVALYRDPLDKRASETMRRITARIEAVAANEDLLALKAILARHLGDPAWARTMPPLVPLSEDRVDQVERIFASTGFGPGAAAA